MKLEVGTKVILQDVEGKILLLKRAKPFRDETFCRWDIPGGRIKLGEMQMQALERELLEETGLHLNGVTEILDVQDIVKKGMHVVRITYWGIVHQIEPIKLNPQEHSAYKWCTFKDMENMQCDPLFAPIIEKLEKQKKLMK